jgi:hypothetical protein
LPDLEARMSQTMIARSEWRWVLVASLLVILFASLPTLYAWSLADGEHVFTGFVYNTEDGNSYIAKMRLGARGAWLFHLFYTPEEHKGALVFTFHMLLGKLAAGVGISLVLAYHLARVLFGLGLLLTVYAFMARFTSEVAVRRVAWALVALGSGLGWLLTVLGATQWLGALPLDFWVPEAYAFLVLYNLPHLALAEALLLWSILWTMDAFEGKGLRWGLCAALAALVMAWIVPFYAGVLAAALGAYLLALLIRRWFDPAQHGRGVPWREAGLTILTGLGAIPPVLYNARVFTTNPAFEVWASQNLILSPHPLHYLLGFVLLLVPAIWGATHAIKQGEERWLLPVAWVLAVPLLLYMPFNLQRRLIAAVQVPLALLAAVGLFIWFRNRRWLPVAYVALVSLSNLLLVAGNLGPISRRDIPIYHPSAEATALAWLADHSQPDEIVLASFEVGNVVPALTDLRVFAGHGPETLHNVEKKDAIHRFFQPETDDQWRQSLLRDYALDYVFYGPQEREVGDWDPATAPYLRPIYAGQGYTIYQVILGDAQP